MAKTRSKRRRKHRGTQAGTVERPARAEGGGKPRSRAEVRETARQRRAERLDRPPTWRGALNRAVIAALLLFVLLAVLRKSVVAALPVAVFMLLVYIPLGYAVDTFIYRLRQRRKAPGGRGGAR